MSGEPLRTGERVTVTWAGRPFAGTIVLASGNGRSIAVAVEDGIIAGFVGGVPLLQDDSGEWCTLTGAPVRVDRVEGDRP